MVRKIFVSVLTILILLAFSPLASAQAGMERMANCLVQQTTGKERILLARWVGFAILAHPSIRGEIGITSRTIEETDKDIAKLITDLMTRRCSTEARAAMSIGSSAIEGAFKTLGEVAMNELLMDKNVNAAFEAFVKYIDEADFSDLLANR